MELRHLLTQVWHFILNSRPGKSFYQSLKRNNVSLVYFRIDGKLSSLPSNLLEDSKPAEHSLDRPRDRKCAMESVIKLYSAAFPSKFPLLEREP